MGEGLKRAALATLATRTWKVRKENDEGHTVAQHELTGPQVVKLYKAIEKLDPQAYKAIDPALTGFADRRVNRALQILRKAGLVSYDRPSKTWVIT